MCQYLPTGGFEWVPCETESPDYWRDFILNQKDEQEEGYIFECDLEYPKELHDMHDTYPLAPEHMDIKEEMLSLYQQDQARKLKIKVGGGKLCLTLKDKANYITHYRNLKQFLKLGLKIKKVHNVLKFKQSPWLKSYIDLNTQLRKKGLSKFEQDFAKLMNNSFFGKVKL